MGVLDRLGQPGNRFETFGVRRLRLFLRRHIPQVEKVENVLKLDELVVVSNWILQHVEASIAFLIFPTST